MKYHVMRRAVCTLVAVLVFVAATGGALADAIFRFAPLGEEVALRRVPAVTDIEALKLPESLEASLSGGGTRSVPVLKWESEPEYGTPGAEEYALRPVFDSNERIISGVKAPGIWVVHTDGDGTEALPEDLLPTNAAPVAGFDELAEEIRFQAYAPGELLSEAQLNLPASLTARDAAGAAFTIGDVSWAWQRDESSPESPEGFDPATPGTYAFRAVLPPGFTAAPGAELPVITVLILDGALVAQAIGETLTTADGLDYIILAMPSDGYNGRVALGDNPTHLTATGFTIPGTITVTSGPNSGTYTVVAIADSAFRGNVYLHGTLTIPGTVTSIGDSAFFGCNNLNGNLTIPNSVTSIGSSAFSGCGFTGELIIPNSATSIGDGAFSGCGFTGELTIPKSVTSIGNSAFSGCGFTGELTIPGTVTSIGDGAFSGCGFTGELTIPGTVTSIGNSAFSGCGFTGELTIPSSVTSIGNSAFDSCSGFTAIDSSLQSLAGVDAAAFSGITDKPLTCSPELTYIHENYGFTDVTAKEFTPGLSVQNGTTHVRAGETFTVSIDLGCAPSEALTASLLTVSNGVAGSWAYTAYTDPGDRDTHPTNTIAACVITPSADGPVTVKIVQGAYTFFNRANSASNIVTVTADITAPAVSSSTPADGATSVPYAAAQTVRVTFSEVMDVNAGTLEVTPAIAGNSAWSGDKRTLTFTPEAEWMPGQAYTVTLSGFSDIAGNPLASGNSIHFITIAKKEVTVKIENILLAQGEPLPEPVVTYDGFLGTDTPDNALAVKAAARLPVANSDTAGRWTIDFVTEAVLNDGNGANYTLTHETGELVIYERSDRCDILRVLPPADAAIEGTDITAKVNHDTASLTVDVAVSEHALWALYEDAACTQVIADNALTLQVGENTAYILVTAEDGLHSKTYMLTITRVPFTDEGKSDRCDILRVLSPADAAIEGTDITAKVNHDTASLTVDVNVSEHALWALYEDAACTQVIADNALTLQVGENTTYILVTAGDGVHSKTYTLTIARAPSSDGDGGDDEDGDDEVGDAAAPFYALLREPLTGMTALSGAVEPGASVIITVGGTEYRAVTDPYGFFYAQLDAPLVRGEAVEIRVTGKGGVRRTARYAVREWTEETRITAQPVGALLRFTDERGAERAVAATPLSKVEFDTQGTARLPLLVDNLYAVGEVVLQKMEEGLYTAQYRLDGAFDGMAATNRLQITDEKPSKAALAQWLKREGAADFPEPFEANEGAWLLMGVEIACGQQLSAEEVNEALLSGEVDHRSEEDPNAALYQQMQKRK